MLRCSHRPSTPGSDFSPSSLQLDGCLLCTPTPARFSSPLLPSSQPISKASPFLLVQRAKKERHFLPNRFPAPACSGLGLAFQRKCCVEPSGGCYLVTVICLFLWDLDLASSHQLKSPNVMFLPVEALQDAPVSPLAV